MSNQISSRKPLGQKAYGHIGHLPSSRMGSGDHRVAPGQADICTKKARDKHDLIIVQEKLDGSCVAAAFIDDQILALGRSGYLAQSSPYEQHQLWADWVRKNEERFRSVLHEGERVCGEWLAQAHGTRYELKHEPFVAFDLMVGVTRANYKDFSRRVYPTFILPNSLHIGGPIAVETAYAQAVKENHHGALDSIEGVVYRVERRGKVDFLAKWVRPDKKDGCYLPSETNQPEIWNWRPGKEAA